MIKYMNQPEKVDARQDTTAEDILRRWSSDILYAILTITNNNGSSGAPAHSVRRRSCEWDVSGSSISKSIWVH